MTKGVRGFNELMKKGGVRSKCGVVDECCKKKKGGKELD